jgi:cytochrome c biogenesis protein CcmG, thiol:disulfide interchange protein DsbE
MKWISWLLMLLLLGVTFSRSHRGGPPLDQEAPSIQAKLLGGAPFSLEAHQGKVIILDFWATWCPPCRASLPALSQVSALYKDDDQVWVGSVNKERLSARGLKDFMKKMKVEFPVILDRTGRISLSYNVTALPTLILIDPQGKVRHLQVGLLTSNVTKLTEHIKALIESARPKV